MSAVIITQNHMLNKQGANSGRLQFSNKSYTSEVYCV